MTNEGVDGATHDAVIVRVRALAADIRGRAAAADAARTVPRESIEAFFAAGIIMAGFHASYFYTLQFCFHRFIEDNEIAC